jgi:choice-of-anchor A domain-containing protein
MRALFALLFLAIPGAVSAGSVDLGVASGYTLFLKDDLKLGTGDFQGYAAVGGELTLSDGVVVKDGTVISVPAGYTGSLKVGDALVEGDGYAGYTYADKIDEFSIPQPELISDFDSAFDYLTDMSASLANMVATDAIEKWSTSLDFTVADEDVNDDVHIFNVSADALLDRNNWYFNNTGDKQVVVNVFGEVNESLDIGGQFINNTQLNYSDSSLSGRQASQLLFNFVDATSVELTGSLYGSVLAPKADMSGAMTLWGQLIANSLDVSGSFNQINYDPFMPVTDSSQPVTEVSEPATWLLMLMAITFIGLRLRQQRDSLQSMPV